MKGLKCTNCGAPLRITRRHVNEGTVECKYCGSSISLDGPTEDDREMLQGLAVFKEMRRFLGFDLDELNAPLTRPHNSAITLANTPGLLFRADIPPAGMTLGNAFLLFFTLFWCGFMVVWNGIGIATGAWVMVAFGLLHDAVGVFLAYLVLWQWIGRETLHAERGRFDRTKRLLFFRWTKSIQWPHVEDFVFKVSSRSGRSAQPGLYLVSGTKRIRLAANASTAELRWLRTELRRFFETIWN
ncbi:MAG: hypothetical protein P9L99_11475 [Candidatus Lernaella stagnicola]|nr:hypothetical protein [Candidatus Lernaella stagnicola]